MKLLRQYVKINRNKSTLQKYCQTTESIVKRKPHF